MLRVLIASLVLTVAAAGGVLLWSHWAWNRAIDEDIRRVAAATRQLQIVTADMLKGLPPPVQRYLTYSGVVGKPIPGVIRVTQAGRIRSDSRSAWMHIEGEEYYSTAPPAFVWKASFPRRDFPVVLGRDEYLEGNGSILMKMLSLYAIANEHGELMNDASLMRYLNEMTWFPAAFLGTNVTWRAVDNNSAEVAISDRGRRAAATLFFDGEGKPVNFRALRYHTGSRRMETWETPFTAYGEFEGLRLPAKGKAVWKLKEGDLDYVELEIVSLDYDRVR